jgi:hypothetical protein
MMAMTMINEELEAAASLQAVLDATVETVYSEKVPTLKERQAALLSAIKTTDVDQLLDLQDVMAKHVDKVIDNAIDLENLGELDDDQLVSLMEEILDQKSIKALVDLRYSMIRAAVFAVITERNVASKIAHPEHAPGEIAVPSLGKKFVRQGGKLKADLDKKKLAELLGEEMWSKVNKAVIVPEVVIPEHVENQFDEDALMKLVNETPVVMEAIRQCVIPAGFTTSSFHVKALQSPVKAEEE